MWILALHDRLYWLLPNRKYVVGRSSTKANQEVHLPVKGDSSVSRKHLTIEVRNPTEDAVLHPSIRSDVIITDLESRYGTAVDGVKLDKGETRRAPLTPNGMFSIKLGAGTKLRLKWQAFVVTYSTGQSGDAHKTLWEHALSKLKSLDAKLMPYIVKSTDVFVKTGRSTSSLYYALCKQIPVANTQYFEALEEAAHAASDHGVADKSVVPDVAPFSPDPKWVPNAERSTCLRGCVFYVPLKEYAEALEPVLTAAGAECVKQDQPNAIYVSPQNSVEQDVPTGQKYVLETEVFAAISDVRSLRPDEIRTKTIIRAAPTRTKPNILEIMTSQPSAIGSSTTPAKKTEGGRVQKAPVTRRSRQPRVLELMVSQDPLESTQTSPQAVEPSPTPSPPKTSDATTTTVSATKTARKREPPTSKPAPSRKKRKVPPEDNIQQENSDEEEQIEVDLDAIGELAIVENSFSTRRNRAQHTTPIDPNVKNFKAFRKAQHKPPKPSHIDFGYMSTQEGGNNEEDDEFFNDTTGNNTTLTGHNSGTDSMIDLAKRTAADSEKEESLFVHSQIESEDDFALDDQSKQQQQQQQQQQQHQPKQPAAAQTDDFAFSFD